MGHKDWIKLPIIGPVFKVGVNYLDSHVGALKVTLGVEKNTKAHTLCQWGGKSLALISPFAGVGGLAWVYKHFGFEAMAAGFIGTVLLCWLVIVVWGCWGGSCDETDEAL